MKLNFFLSKSANSHNIYLSIVDKYLKTNHTINTKISISPDEWDVDKQRPYNIYLKRNKKINVLLDTIKLSISEYVYKCKKKSEKILLKDLSILINNIRLGKKEILPKKTILFFMEKYISIKRDIVSNSTYKRYIVFLRLFSRFEAYSTKRYFIDKVDGCFINNFIRFGRSEGYRENTIYRTISFVKTILNFAEREGLNTNVRKLTIRREKQQRVITTLNEEELLIINQTKVPKSLESAKDWLIISCYTGQRFSDFIKFDTDKLVKIHNKICIKFTQQKTKKEMVIPLHPVVLDILSKYNNSFPLTMSMNNYNKKIKLIARKAKINKVMEGNKREGFRVKKEMFSKWQLMSSHIGRRSFASNFYGKIPTPLLMEATGHSTEKMFLNYINPINNDRIIKLSSYFDKMNKFENLPLLD